jgi:integrase
MPKIARELSAIEIRRLTSAGTYAVGGVKGLLLRVTPSGTKSWVLRYATGEIRTSKAGLEFYARRDHGLGSFPSVSLAQARQRAQEAFEAIRQGVDPVEMNRQKRSDLRRSQRKLMTFAQAAQHCHAKVSAEAKNAKHAQQWINTLKQYAFPHISGLPVDEVTTQHVVDLLVPIWTLKPETASRVRQRIESTLTWATVSGYREGDNPARLKGNLDQLLPRTSKIKKVTHFKALPWRQVPPFLETLRKREGMGARALELLILTVCRSGEVRGAAWPEFDLQSRLWRIPADRMKSDKEHQIPLSTAAISLLKTLPRLDDTELLFPSAGAGTISDMTLTAVLRRMNVDATVHGFRSSFKDWCRNCTQYPDEVSELQLAHVNSDATRAAYARDELLPQRARLMQQWCQYLNSKQQSAKVVPIVSSNIEH